jgi:hypothetical protein
MKRGNDIQRFSCACAIVFSALASFTQPALATEAFKDVSKTISDLRSVIGSANVYLIGRDQSFIRAYDEIDVVRSGCRYVITSAADLDSLIEVLANARLEQVPASEDGYDARIVIRLYQGDSRVHTLVLGPDYSNANSNGEYRFPAGATNSVIPVEAKNGIERDLRFWVSQHRSLAPKACGR